MLAHQSQCLNQKNIIDPEKIINNYGADSARLFILSDSPPEKDVQWSDEGIAASYKFIQKLWNLNLKIINKIESKTKKIENNSNELDKITHRFINDVTNNLKNFSYNKIIANLHKIYSQLSKELEKNYSNKSWIENYSQILITMMPVIPHFASESLMLLKLDYKNIKWPKIKENLLKDEKIKYVVQINGKKRGLIDTDYDISEEELVKLIKNDINIHKYLENKEIKKKIFIPNKLINIIL